MRIFLDTANIDEIRQAARLGVVSGVTTNPSLVAQWGKADLRGAIEEICTIIDGPVSAEVLSLEAEAMIQEAMRQVSMAGIGATQSQVVFSYLKTVIASGHYLQPAFRQCGC